jgi:hypothetical protein
MDLSSVKPVERIVQITHPGTGVELGVSVSIMSIADERMKKIKRAIQDRRLALQQRGKNFKSDDLEENGCQLVFNAMTGWEWTGEASFQGSKPAFNFATVQKVFEELPWFRNQLEEAISDEAAFFQISEPDLKKPAASTFATSK